MPTGAQEPTLLQAPTLGQFWRSDATVTPGRRRVRWPGLLAFWLGLASTVLFWGGLFAEIPVLAQIAFPVSVVALFFALVAIVAGVGRALGVLGVVVALLGNAYFWQLLS